MKYADKLKDPRWQKKRLEILSRDSFTCQLCSDTTTELHIHHKEYDFGLEPWEYDNDILITLCKNCHHIEGDPRESTNIKMLKVEKLKVNDRTVMIFCLCHHLDYNTHYISIFEYSPLTDVYDWKTIIVRDDLDALNRLSQYSRQITNEVNNG